eukprot:g2139.t1
MAGFWIRKKWVEYKDDDAARKGEREICRACDEENPWSDDDFFGGEALFRGLPLRGFPPVDQIKWARASDAFRKDTENRFRLRKMKDPSLFKEGIRAGDVIQGRLGNCWFISALSVIATRPELLSKLFVSDRHCRLGIYTVKFFKDGKWVYLWVMLIEKAYAKLHGCYENLVSGWVDYGLRDLTGGAPMKIKFSDNRIAKMLNDGQGGVTLFRMLQTQRREGSLLGCSFAPAAKDDGDAERDMGLGILSAHAYGILNIVELQVADNSGFSEEEEEEEEDDDEDDVDNDESSSNVLRLLQLRNPWGMREWSGDWSDNDVMWDDYPDVRAKLVGKEGFKDDGTFWISWDDFVGQFNQIFVCIDRDDAWHGVRFDGSWKLSTTHSYPGGCPKFAKTFAKNPQYTFRVTESTSMAVVIFQRDIRWHDLKMKYSNGVGFVLMSMPEGASRISKFSSDTLVGASRSFVPGRHVYTKLLKALDPGRYAIIPCKFRPEEDRDPEDKTNTFGLEIFTSKPIVFDSEDGIAIPDTMEDRDDAAASKGSTETDSIDDSFVAVQDAHDKPEPEEEGRAMRALESEVSWLENEYFELRNAITAIERRLDEEMERRKETASASCV